MAELQPTLSYEEVEVGQALPELVIELSVRGQNSLGDHVKGTVRVLLPRSAGAA